jgi:hypothetical protein
VGCLVDDSCSRGTDFVHGGTALHQQLGGIKGAPCCSMVQGRCASVWVQDVDVGTSVNQHPYNSFIPSKIEFYNFTKKKKNQREIKLF